MRAATIPPASEAEDLGSYIRSKRLALDLGLRAMARNIGVSPTYLSRIERGQLHPGEEVLAKIASALGENVDLMLAGESRIAPDLQAIILEHPQASAMLIRNLKGLSEFEVQQLARKAMNFKRGPGTERSGRFRPRRGAVARPATSA